MSRCGTFLQGPRDAAVSCRDERTVTTGGPAVCGIVRSKSDRKQMILCRCLDSAPAPTAIRGHQDDTARTHGKRAPTRLNVESIQVSQRSRVLSLPFKAAIGAVENYAIRTDGPAMAFVFREPNRIDRIALRARVLPLPAAIERLGGNN